MRDILFRGKTILGNFFVTGSYYKSCDLYGNECNEILLQLGNKYIVAPETVGQYTGFKDIHGKKIFEGDIISAHLDELFPEEESRHVVKFHDGAFRGWNLNFKMWDDLDRGFASRFQIIGNEFDNPELLEVAKK